MRSNAVTMEWNRLIASKKAVFARLGPKSCTESEADANSLEKNRGKAAQCVAAIVLLPAKKLEKHRKRKVK